MRVEISAPATTANLGPGFDTLGAALTPRLRIVAEPGGRVERDVVVRAAEAVAGRLPPMTIVPHAGFPRGRGLGSSAAAIACGLLLGCAMARRAPDPLELLALGLPIEGHPDNLAPCLLGGLVLCLPSGPVRFEVRADLRPVVLVPRESLPTKKARNALPPTVAMADAVSTSSRTAGLLAILTGSASPGRLMDCTEDVLHQPHRAPLMPRTAETIASLRSDGVAAVLSGAGPSVLCLLKPGQDVDAPDGWSRLDATWDTTGARLDVVEDG